ncbi:MAG: family 43 glycosylhydrolase [Bacteroides sp.]|nr:family 43 glycosylhydrolase [Bacteroides sp.]MCM1096139.1 family 43 glycosylhydrolase [Terasakiella sp.]
MRYSRILISSFVFCSLSVSAARTDFTPGAVWNDTRGTHINAHGGCVVHHEGKYYWFGEDRTGYDSNGVSCYTSTDLYNWTRSGLVFKAAQAKDPDTGKCILERPKVVHNDKTGKWVMYIHWENGDGYGEARVCVAVCDKIDGNYDFVSTFRPNNHDSRDQTVFKDTDGRAYHFGSTDMNTNMNVALLSADYLSTETNPVTETKILKGLRYEAPAIIKAGDTYFGVFSGCTGWDPNPGHSATATDILGHWQTLGNFAIDKGGETTYRSQSTYIFKVDGYDGAYVYMGDRWNSSDVGGKSEYVWLPLSLRSGAPTVKWYESWTLDVFADCDRWARLDHAVDGAVVRILDKYSDRWMSTKGNGFFIDDDSDATNMDFRLEKTANPYVWRFVEVKSGKYLESMFGALVLADGSGAASQDWRLELMEDGCYHIQCVKDGKVLTVSGDSRLASSPMFLVAKGAAEAQCFGLYFDTKAHGDLPRADMFSAAYRADNLARIEAQEAYESAAGIGEVAVARGATVRADGRDALVVSGADGVALTLTVVEAASGRAVAVVEAVASQSGTRVALPSALGRGVYVVTAVGATGHSVNKIVI